LFPRPKFRRRRFCLRLRRRRRRFWQQGRLRLRLTDKQTEGQTEQQTISANTFPDSHTRQRRRRQTIGLAESARRGKVQKKQLSWARTKKLLKLFYFRVSNCWRGWLGEARRNETFSQKTKAEKTLCGNPGKESDLISRFFLLVPSYKATA
jgi:hypothetical protein